MGSEAVDLGTLKKRASRSGKKFWASLCAVILLGSMIVPYLSFASVSVSNSTVFTGAVIPGYSMGGVQLGAYGVDLNEWAEVSGTKLVETNYGVWSSSRYSDGQKAASTSIKSIDSTSLGANSLLSTAQKSEGWQSITGKTNYSKSNGNGVSNAGQSSYYDDVSPYRTPEDVKFWKDQTGGGTSATKDITVSLYPDFAIFSFNGTHAQILVNPDDATAQTDTASTNSSSSPDNPVYVPLSTLFDAFGLNKATATIDDLMAAIGKNTARDGMGEYSPILDDIVANPDNDLLNNAKTSATTYDNHNNDGTGIKTSNAFNPYPYSMVFQKSDANGNIITSSVYENCEAYVFFSPESVYNQYVSLRTEYEKLITSSTKEVQDKDPVFAFQAGYYLSAMSILESYLGEALPQDMTRGYVGPTESDSISGSDGAGGSQGSLASTILSNASNESLKKAQYSTLLYDIAKPLTSNLVGTSEKSGASFALNQSNPVMDTLSTFGYSVTTDTSPSVDVAGVMKGMSAHDAYSRLTSFTAYPDTVQTTGSAASANGELQNAGLYTPTYFPIQQHNMPENEKMYRFQITTVVPYKTVVSYLSEGGFANGATLKYSASSTSQFTSVSDYKKKLGSLAYQAQSGLDNSLELSEFNGQKGASIVCSPETATSTGGIESSDSTSTQVQKRVDQALSAYASGSMNSDNVHDFVDIVRAVKDLKSETWSRYYNPLKSEGGDTDIFLARISPAATPYMPSMLFNGYEPAGGSSINASPSGVSFDYYSTPSLAPCLASHTSSTTYYGSLNYEQRAFYVKKLLDTLPKEANIPLLEQAQEAQDAMADAENQADAEYKNIQGNISGIFVLAKRVAFANALQKVSTIGSVSVSASDLLDALNSLPDNAVVAGQNMMGAEGSTALNALKNELSSNTGKSVSWLSPNKGKFFATTGGADAFIGDDTGKVGVLNDTFGVSEVAPAGWLYKTADGSYQILTQGTDTADNNSGGIKDDKKSTVPAQSSDQVLLSNKNNGVWLSGSVFFSVLYNKELNALLGEGGEYYWEKMETIMSSEYPQPSLSSGTTLASHGDSNEKNSKYSVMLDSAALQSTTDTMAKAAEDYKTQLDEYCAEVFKGVTNMQKDEQLYLGSMPTSMQNCLAWGDYQNASDSDAQYQTDPSMDTVTINVSATASADTSSTTGTVHSASDLGSFGYSYSNGGIAPSSTSSSSSSSADKDGRIIRGVEGSTWTSTGTPACYTMSATVGRTELLASGAGTVFPYSGLVNGRLSSGTDQYAVNQSHVIDYSSIASGIAGDLSTRQRSQLVKMSNTNYSSIPNLTDLVSLAGGFMGDAGSSMLKGSTSLFSALFWTSSGAEAQTTQNSDTATATASSMSGAIPATVAASSFNHVNYTTAPASGVSHETSWGTAGGNGISSGVATASAAGNVENGMANFWLSNLWWFYGIVQSIGIGLVLISLLYIGFANFFAYMGSAASASKQIEAQRQLKVVLPRALIAILMIGLPQVSPDGTAFQGGGFILLQLVSMVLDQITGVFINLDGTSIMSIWANLQPPGSGIGDYLIFFICALIISLMMVVAAVFVFAQQVFCALFYLVSPIVWGFFVWPTINWAPRNVSAGEGKKGAGSIFRKYFTGGAAGSDMAKGWLGAYAAVSLLTVCWAIILWASAIIFMSISGSNTFSATGAATANAATGFGYSNAGYAVATASGFFGDDWWNTVVQTAPWLTLVIGTFLAVVVFLLMIKMMLEIFKGTAFNVAGLAHDAVVGTFQAEKGDKWNAFNDYRNGENGSATVDRAAVDSNLARVINGDGQAVFQKLAEDASDQITKLRENELDKRQALRDDQMFELAEEDKAAVAALEDAADQITPMEALGSSADAAAAMLPAVGALAGALASGGKNKDKKKLAEAAIADMTLEQKDFLVDEGVLEKKANGDYALLAPVEMNQRSSHYYDGVEKKLNSSMALLETGREDMLAEMDKLKGQRLEESKIIETNQANEAGALGEAVSAVALNEEEGKKILLGDVNAPNDAERASLLAAARKKGSSLSQLGEEVEGGVVTAGGVYIPRTDAEKTLEALKKEGQQEAKALEEQFAKQGELYSKSQKIAGARQGWADELSRISAIKDNAGRQAELGEYLGGLDEANRNALFAAGIVNTLDNGNIRVNKSALSKIGGTIPNESTQRSVSQGSPAALRGSAKAASADMNGMNMGSTGNEEAAKAKAAARRENAQASQAAAMGRESSAGRDRNDAQKPRRSHQPVTNGASGTPAGAEASRKVGSTGRPRPSGRTFKSTRPLSEAKMQEEREKRAHARESAQSVADAGEVKARGAQAKARAEAEAEANKEAKERNKRARQDRLRGSD